MSMNHPSRFTLDIDTPHSLTTSILGRGAEAIVPSTPEDGSQKLRLFYTVYSLDARCKRKGCENVVGLAQAFAIRPADQRILSTTEAHLACYIMSR